MMEQAQSTVVVIRKPSLDEPINLKAVDKGSVIHASAQLLKVYLMSKIT